MRFGPRFNATCAKLTTLGGDLLAWVGICRYLGVYFSSARTFNGYSIDSQPRIRSNCPTSIVCYERTKLT